MFEHVRDSVFCSHHLSRVLVGIVSREWAQDTLDNDGKEALRMCVVAYGLGRVLRVRRSCFA